MNPVKQTIRNTISLNIPDNHVRQVTPALLREVLAQMLDFSEQVIAGGIQDLTTTEDAAEWDVELGSKATLLLTDDVTLSITNSVAGGMYWLIVKQNSTGNNTITFPANSIIESAQETLIEQGPETISILTALFDGTDYLWSGKDSNSNAATLWQQTEW